MTIEPIKVTCTNHGTDLGYKYACRSCGYRTPFIQPSVEAAEDALAAHLENCDPVDELTPHAPSPL